MTELFTPLEAYDPGLRSSEYITSLLVQGRTLARAAAGRFIPGRCEVVLPQGTSDKEVAASLECGGLWPASDRRLRWESADESVSPVAWLTERIHDALSQTGWTCFIENSLDREPECESVRYATPGQADQSEMYYVLRSGATRAEIRDVLEEADNAWLMLGFMVGRDSAQLRDLSVASVDSFVKGLAGLFCTALDGETYLFCWGGLGDEPPRRPTNTIPTD